MSSILQVKLIDVFGEEFAYASEWHYFKEWPTIGDRISVTNESTGCELCGKFVAGLDRENMLIWCTHDIEVARSNPKLLQPMRLCKVIVISIEKAVANS